MDIATILKDFDFKKSKLNQRQDLFKQIYSFYDTGQEIIHRKKYNWKKYVEFLKENRIPNTPENIKKFKRSKKFQKKMSAKTMACYWLSHVKTPDLWFVLSVAKDKAFRNECVSAYIMSLSTWKVDKKF